MSKNLLLPCPFCGKWAHAAHHNSKNKDDEHYLVMCAYCFARTVGETLEEAIAAWNRRADGWIPVSERLPGKDGNYVLVIASGKPRQNITLESAYELAEYNEKEGWILENYLEWEDAEVAYWMPLPAPPKEVHP